MIYKSAVSALVIECSDSVEEIDCLTADQETVETVHEIKVRARDAFVINLSKAQLASEDRQKSRNFIGKQAPTFVGTTVTTTLQCEIKFNQRQFNGKYRRCNG